MTGISTRPTAIQSLIVAMLTAMTTLTTLAPATAAAEETPSGGAEQASLPMVAMPSLRTPTPHPLGRFKVSAVCDGAVVTFKVTSEDRRWPERGELRILDGSTGTLVRSRALVFKTTQSAGFRVPSGSVSSDRYRVSIVDMSGGVTYEKTFIGRCQEPPKSSQTAAR